MTTETGEALPFVDTKEVARLEAELRRVATAAREVGTALGEALSAKQTAPLESSLGKV